MTGNLENPFIFLPRYRLLRHLVFWIMDAVVFNTIFRSNTMSYPNQFLLSAIWVPLHMAIAYPIMYIFIPHFLLKRRYWQFVLIMVLWGVAGWYWNYVCRAHIIIPLENVFPFTLGTRNYWAANSFLSMVVIAGFGSTIVLFKYWITKQREFLNSEKEKAITELQLLKAQIHPHFLFNTLNNIYSFSMKGSAKTTDMIAKLSSLLSYILYDGKKNEVLLEKEIEVMKN